LKPCAIQVPVATPMMYPASETTVWLASDSDRCATARPASTMLPVMTLLKTPPSRVKLATSIAPDPKVSAIAISVRICCLDLVCISIAATRSGLQAGRNSRPTSSGMSVRRATFKVSARTKRAPQHLARNRGRACRGRAGGFRMPSL
jgi:hypothetical protein